MRKIIALDSFSSQFSSSGISGGLRQDDLRGSLVLLHCLEIGVGFLIRFLTLDGKNTLNAWPGPVKMLPWFEQIVACTPRCVECALTKMLLGWVASVPNAVVIQRLVKNLNRRKEGWIPVHSLQIVSDCRFRNAKVAGI